MISQAQDSDSEFQKQRERELIAMPIWQLRAMREGALRSCLNCEQFNKITEGCAIAGDQRPPATVIALGCSEWIFDIPF